MRLKAEGPAEAEPLEMPLTVICETSLNWWA
jgi:hypothetical protein